MRVAQGQVEDECTAKRVITRPSVHSWLVRRQDSGNGGGTPMRPVRAALIQAQANMSKQEAIDKHVKMIPDAAGQRPQVGGLPEILHRPYFCAEQDPKWDGPAEPGD